jgi:hypothetical protein
MPFINLRCVLERTKEWTRLTSSYHHLHRHFLADGQYRQNYYISLTSTLMDVNNQFPISTTLHSVKGLLTALTWGTRCARNWSAKIILSLPAYPVNTAGRAVDKVHQLTITIHVACLQCLLPSHQKEW